MGGVPYCTPCTILATRPSLNPNPGYFGRMRFPKGFNGRRVRHTVYQASGSELESVPKRVSLKTSSHGVFNLA